MKEVFRTYVALGFLIISTSLTAQLSGIYTIGSTGNYPNLRIAIDSLANQGMSASVTFNYLANNLDTTPVKFPNNIIGLTATDTLLIQTTPGSRQPATLENRNRNNQQSYMVDCNLKHVTFNYLKIYTDSGYGSLNAGMILGNGTIQNSIIWSPYSYQPIITILSNSTIENCSIEGNKGTGVLISSGSKNVLLINNTIRGYFPTGVYSSNGKHNLITKNAFSCPKKMTAAIGLLYADSVYITKNEIQEYGDPTSGTQYFETGINIRFSNNCFVQNNMIHCEGTAYRQYSGTNNRIEHNSFYDSRDSSKHALVHLSSVAGHGNNYFRNNISATQHGHVLYLQVDPGSPDYFKSMNFNDWFSYSDSLKLSYESSSFNNYTSLVYWSKATTRDSNSVSHDPEFLIPPDLHIQTSDAIMRGILIPYITDDIDGDKRSIPGIVMGADEVQLTSVREQASSSNKIRLYPNPSHSEINLDFNEIHGLQELSVYDIHGREVFTKKLNPEMNSISVLTENLLSGMYIVRIKSFTSLYSIHFTKE